MTVFPSLGAINWILRRFGVQVAQYRLLVDLFGTLSERHEVTGNLGMDRQALRLGSFLLLLPGLGMALLAFVPMSLSSYVLTLLTFSSVPLLLLLVSEAANSFFNPAEVSVLAHRPISARTYLAAKVSYLTLIVGRAELALNGPGALTGLLRSDARWYFPVTHLLAAFLLGGFIAVITSAMLGFLMRLVPLSRLRAAALWVQLLVGLLPVAINVVLPLARSARKALGPATSGIDWSFVPVIWCASISTAGHQARVVITSWPLALASMGLWAVFIVFGARSLSAGYMTRIVAILSSHRARRRRRSAILGRTVGWLAGSPAGRAAWEFVTTMMRRDWQFRRAMSQTVLLLVAMVPLLRRGLASASPFSVAVPSSVSLMPEFLGLATLFVCLALTPSDHHRAAWIFGRARRSALERYATGTFLTVWLPLVVGPTLLGAVVLTAGWGARDAWLFALYGLSVGSLLLGLQFFFVEGLPFGEPPKATRAFVILPIVIFGPIVLGVAWIVQARLLFQSRWATVAVAPVILAAAVAVVRLTTRVLVVRMEESVRRRSAVPGRLFKTIEES